MWTNINFVQFIATSGPSFSDMPRICPTRVRYCCRYKSGLYCTDLYIYRTRFSCAELQDDPTISPEPSESENVWVTFAYGFVAVTIINLSSIGGLMIVPLMNKRAYHRGKFSSAPVRTRRTAVSLKKPGSSGEILDYSNLVTKLNSRVFHVYFRHGYFSKNETEKSTFIFHCHGCFCASFKRFISFDSTSTRAECPHKSKIWRNNGDYICWILWFLCRWKTSWYW